MSTERQVPADEIIRRRLRRLFERGIFQGFHEAASRHGKIQFRFRWLLSHDFVLVLDQKRHKLIASDLLPAIAYRSFIDTDLRRFVAQRFDPKRPVHRRLDTKLITLSLNNRKQSVSLVMSTRQYEYAINSMLGVLNDLFAHLHLYHIDYLHQNFGLPEE
ncbi:MAG: hypothetical protein O3A63_01155 [Proteobacteria bacterium]|nr:hypothetical protein [Pseudomonadota bacterium]